ncbi:MAG: hypothetical protein HRT57_17435 [Crocinitomicaceae bacterium]|nr:hypothetical protein [Crocinitomicaceae bacterium]
MGGTALGNNLYPISKGANGKHLSTAENYVKSALWKDKTAVKYSVNVIGATNYSEASQTNAKAAFNTTVRPWNDVTDKSAVGDVIYSAKITSDLGELKVREAEDASGEALKNISGGGLKKKKPNEPAKTVKELKKNIEARNQIHFELKPMDIQ